MLRGYLRPPLATQLFDDRDMFVRTMAEFPRMQPLVARLREGAVEQKLERLQTEAPEFPERYSELLAIRFYIQCVIARCQIQWDADVARGITNYKALFNYIERWRESKYRRVCVVTFSYDTLADDALTEAGRITLRSPANRRLHRRGRIQAHQAAWISELGAPIKGARDRRANQPGRVRHCTGADKPRARV